MNCLVRIKILDIPMVALFQIGKIDWSTTDIRQIYRCTNYRSLSVAPSIWPELYSPNLYLFQVSLEVSRGSSKKDSYKQVSCLWKFSTKSSWLKQLALTVFLFHSVNFWLTWVIIIKICWFERGTVERFQSSIKKMEFQFQ